MSRGTKIIIWLLIIAGLLALGYFLIKKEKTFSFTFGPGFDSLKEAIPKEEKEAAESFKNVLKEKTAGLRAEGESVISQSVQLGKETILSTIKQGLEITKKTAGEILGVSDDSNLFIEYFSYLTKINEPLSFMLKNPFSPTESKELNYQIDWGDNLKDEGKLQGGQSIIISHFWKKQGEYLAKFKMTALESEIFNYQIKVLVIK